MTLARIICFLSLILCLASCDFIHGGIRQHYHSAGNDVADIDFKLFNDKTFRILIDYVGEDPDLPSVSYKGTYREWENVYDLTFDNLNREQVQELFHPTPPLFVLDSAVFRMPKDLQAPNAVKIYIVGGQIEKAPHR